MELTFHSIDELREFLAWRDEQHERALNGERPPVGQYKTVLADGPVDTSNDGDGDGEQASESAAQTEAPKRTRRTKAQIKADRLATEQSQAEPANPSVTQNEPPNQQAGLLGQGDDTNSWPDEALILERASHLVVDPAVHLKDSRDFIAAWGLPAYFETQQAAKVGNNAITYEAGDRARHAAAMQLYAETHNKTRG